MSAVAITTSQRSQLQVLSALVAFDKESAVAASKWNGLNGVMLGVALEPKGLVGKRVQRAQYGEPKRTLYWLTEAGVAALAASYDAAADAAEQLP